MESYVEIWWSQSDDNTTRRMRFAYWITKATDTDSEYVLLTAYNTNRGIVKMCLSTPLRHTGTAEAELY